MRIKLNVPEDLSEITLAQYQRWIKIAEKQEEVNTFYQQKMIEIFCNANLQDIMQMRLKDIQEITTHLVSILILIITLQIGSKWIQQWLFCSVQ